MWLIVLRKNNHYLLSRMSFQTYTTFFYFLYNTKGECLKNILDSLFFLIMKVNGNWNCMGTKRQKCLTNGNKDSQKNPTFEPNLFRTDPSELNDSTCCNWIILKKSFPTLTSYYFLLASSGSVGLFCGIQMHKQLYYTLKEKYKYQNATLICFDCFVWYWGMYDIFKKLSSALGP